VALPGIEPRPRCRFAARETLLTLAGPTGTWRSLPTASPSSDFCNSDITEDPVPVQYGASALRARVEADRVLRVEHDAASRPHPVEVAGPCVLARDRGRREIHPVERIEALG
jgi:hypothetical protein